MEKTTSVNPANPITQKVQSVVNKFPDTSNKENMKMIGIAIAVILAGILTGGLLSGKLLAKGSKGPSVPNVKSTSSEAGVKDEKTFKDTAEGILKAGGIKGEGTFHLERPGGDTQTVYVTSTVIDLSTFNGKKVQIWGQTYAGKNTPWLMDVGRVKVIE